MVEKETLIVQGKDDYELLDSGKEMKLERYGSVILARPDPQALWERRLPESKWLTADASYSRKGKEGVWRIRPETPESWNISYAGLSLIIKPTSFKHTGLFPEQRAHWEWTTHVIKKHHSGTQVKVLNLFGYTGGATLAAAHAGAHVTHVDASKVAVSWARDNAQASGLETRPIRWIIDDVFAFVRREIKRGNTYDLIIMDPPAFGRGPKGELWKIEEGFVALIHDIEKLLSPKALGVLVSGYAAGYSHHSYENVMHHLVRTRGGVVTGGEIALQESGSARLLSCGIFARWSA